MPFHTPTREPADGAAQPCPSPVGPRSGAVSATHTDSTIWISASDLRRRGWTERLFRVWLVGRVRLAPNPHYSAGPPARWFLASDVERLLRSEAFQADWQATQAMAEPGRERAQGDRQALCRWAATAPIQTRPIPLEALALRAIELATDYPEAFDDDAWRCHPGSSQALDWLLFSTARIACTNFTSLIDACFAMCGSRPAQRILRARTFAAIASDWPELAGEAERQWRWCPDISSHGETP